LRLAQNAVAVEPTRKEPPDDQPMNVGGRISSAQRVW
jgi:hypothetical protein